MHGVAAGTAAPGLASMMGRTAGALSAPWIWGPTRTDGRSGVPVGRTALTLIGTLHRRLYRWSGGRVGGTLRGGSVLLLTTTGRRTGQARTWPLCYLAVGDELVLIASARGAPCHPAWYLNLRAHPRVRIQRGGTTHTMVARTAAGTERARLWERVVEQYPVCAAYQRQTSRAFPLVLLRPTPPVDAAPARADGTENRRVGA